MLPEKEEKSFGNLFVLGRTLLVRNVCGVNGFIKGAVRRERRCFTCC